MKQLMLATCIGVLSLAATAQTAGTAAPAQDEQTSVQVRRYEIDLPATPHRASDFATYKGGYELSNGDTMVLHSRGQHMFAVVGDRPPVELVAAAPNVFVAVDKQLKMTLEEQIAGPIRGELLMASPTQAAQAQAVSLVAR